MTSLRRLPPPLVGVAMVVAACVVGTILTMLFGKTTIPAATLLASAIDGLVASLFAAGLLLVHRANRLISFAHASISLGASILFTSLFAQNWSYWLAAPAAIAFGVSAGAAIEVLVLRRFAYAPRIVATVATIAVGQLLVTLVFAFPQWRFGVNLFGNLGAEELGLIPNTEVHFPWEWKATFDGVRFTQDHVVAVVVSLVALGSLGLFLRRSAAGTAIRAAAENASRAEQLGIGVGVLATLVWALAGGLAGLSAVLREPIAGSSISSVITGGAVGLSAGVLLRGLAAAVLARMEDLSIAVGAAVAIAVFDRSVLWATSRGAITDVVLLVVVAAALLLQRRRLSRTEEAASSTWAATEEVRPIPAVLAALPSVRAARRWALTVLAIVIVGYPFAMSPSQVYLGSTYAIYGIVAVSLVVLTGWGGQISLGQFALVAVGSSVGGALTANAHVPFPIALVLASAVGAGVAVLLGLPALRIRGLYLAVTTLAFAVAMESFVLDRTRFAWLVPADVGRPRLGPLKFEDERAYYFLCLAGLIAAVLMATALRRTRTGRVLIAMRDNERAAQSMGLSLVRVRLATFAISGFIAAMAGVLLAHQQQAVRPEGLGPEQSIGVFLMAIIGGLGSVSGVVTGAIYAGSVTIFVKGALGQLLATGVGVLAVLLFFPRGLGGVVFAIRDSWLRRIALRERIYVRSLLGDQRALDSERAPLAEGDAPEPKYRVESEIRIAGDSQRSKGWVYR